jgi:hypothetical protein
MVIGKKGAAIPLVLITMFVLSLLGTAIWQYSMADTIHVARDELRMKAYYLARSGAEATLQAWMQSPLVDKPFGSSNTVYLDGNTDKLVTSLPDEVGGSFDVSVTEESNVVKITSVGTVQGVSQTVRVSINPEFTYGHELNWYQLTSGQILDPSGYVPPDEITGIHGSVVMQAKETGNHGKLQSIKDPNTPTTFEAESLFFTSDVSTHKTIVVSAETIVFYGDIQLKITGQDNGRLILKVPEIPEKGISMGISIDETSNLYGRIYFKDFKIHNQSQAISGRRFYFLKKSGGIDLRDTSVRVKRLNNTITRIDGTVNADYPPVLIEFDTSESIPSPESNYRVTWE